MSNLHVEIKKLEKSFRLPAPVRGHNSIPVLRGIDLELRQGRSMALVGESGCGKTTLGKILMGMERVDQGTILIDGKDQQKYSTAEARSQFQMVFQDPHASLNPRWTLEKILEEPLLPQNLSAEVRQEKVQSILKSVGFDESILGRRIHTFSGGQKQRLVIARALLMDPKILICDEPVSALDVSIQGQILNLLNRLKVERNLGFLFISHDLSVVRSFADEVAILYLGRIVERGPADTVLSKPKHPYTRLLLDSIPSLGADWDPFQLAESGETPSPFDIKQGCSFLSRCRFASEKCQKSPSWIDAGSGGYECYHPL